MAEIVNSSGKTLTEVIVDNLSSPKSAEVDGQKVEQHSLSEQIKADEYLSKKQAAKNAVSGLKFTRLAAPGAN